VIPPVYCHHFPPVAVYRRKAVESTKIGCRPPPPPEGGGSPRSASCFLPSAPQASPKRPGVLRRRPQKIGGRRRAEREREQSQAGAEAEDWPPIRLLCFLPSAPQPSPKWVLRRRLRKFGGRRRAEREREQRQASRGWGWGLAPDLLALLSAFCAAGQPKVGAAPQAEKIWWPTTS
jgi:hypothetical protein